MSAASPPWKVTEGPGPLCAAAIHDGHGLSPEVAALTALSDAARLREEDPYTGAWTVVAPTRVVVERSRFEVDLNRPRERAVYRLPEDAWGLELWKQEPGPALVDNGLRLYDGFYRTMRRQLDRIAQQHRRFVLLDLHSYNHRRAGPGAAFDPQSQNPDVNIGTGSLDDRAAWAPLVDRLIADLTACEDLGRRLDVRENVKFRGGQLGRWVHATYPGRACCLSLEFKKIFMDEWTGVLDEVFHQGIARLLDDAVAGLLEQLDRLP